jgi:hypothetical protein
MATRLPNYQMRDGRTRLGQDYFNPIWADLDNRLDTLERIKLDWNAQVAQLRDLGLQRIDEYIRPVVDEVNEILQQARDDTDGLAAALVDEHITPLVTQVNQILAQAQADTDGLAQALVDEHIAPILTQAQQLLSDIQSIKQAAEQDADAIAQELADVGQTRAVAHTLTAPIEAPNSGAYEIHGSAVSRHVNGSIVEFEVTWWDMTVETVTAVAGEATLSKAVDQPIGGSVSAAIRAIDDIGNASATETVSATVVEAYIATPSVISPPDGATNVPEQPVIETSAFAVVNDTDTHVATSLHIYDATNTLVWELTESATLNDIVVPAGILEEGAQNYTIQARHHGQTLGASAWSAPITITTSASFVPDFETEIGEPYGGGYVAGKIVSDYDGVTYGLIVSDGGGDSVQMGAGTMPWRSAQTAVSTTHGVPPMTLADGRANHNAILALNALSEFPAFKWIEDNVNATALNGHDDWYLPARDELEIIYRNFKPTTQDNNDGTRTTAGFGGDGLTHGTNANSVPEGAGYTLSNPSQTAQAAFQAGGADAFEANHYWSSTENDASYAWFQLFSSGGQGRSYKTNGYRVRAVRRVAL